MDDWAGALHSEAAVGDSGPWTRHLPTMWAALADPRGRHPVPSPAQARDAHGDRIAYWAPLPQLLHFVLGWRHAETGLVAWDDAGRPTDTPATALLARWWGSRVEHYLAWAAVSPAGRQVAQGAALAAGAELPARPNFADAYARVRADPDWRGVWGGGGDAMHLASHAVAPLWGPESQPSLLLGPAPAPGQPPRGALLLDGYAGWYAALCREGRELSWHPGERSWRVDVLVRPLGYLGTYRRSRLTGRWFAGRHRDHAMGA